MNGSVTIITPVYNAMPYLPNYLDSLLYQDHRPLEVILVNDGSDDDSLNVMEAGGGRTEKVSMDKDAFTVMYLKCRSLRSSCYSCPYTRCDLPFDISIGDLWEMDCPEYRDGKGLSLVITRTPEGNALLDRCRDRAVIRQINGKSPLQPSLQAPAPKSLLRKLLFRDYRSIKEKEEDITLLLDKYGRYIAP